MLKHILSLLVVVAATAPAAAQQAAKADPALVDKYIADTFKSAPQEWRARIEQDDAQRVCSQTRGEPPTADAKRLMESAQAAVVYPADGNVLGDWKNGEKLAQRGTGGQFSDGPNTAKGGNCYACHQLAIAEVSYGTLGPSLHEYGKIRKYRPDEAKAAYAKIFNAQVLQPCSNMPRFGHNKFLSPDEIKDLTAYLFDPASPVNK
jgi:sulfur-oxidizing protein SoxX